MPKPYIEKLKDPRWQRKRLEIFERDGWKCQVCQDNLITLAVHHKVYLPNKEPWEYPDELLGTLCENCHTEEMERGVLEQSIIHQLRKLFYINELFILNNGLELSKASNKDSWMISEVIRWLLSSPDLQKELIDRFSKIMRIGL
ncbi:hypothetical protein LCGC14_0627970 [marine sediment metagenome]|uniref:HNH endonuclease n=1 Tax=marine sediment metagenome TaxID=412755 RepID=A0A0F9RMB5_9ZZZZ